jgi:hypothetical protein
VERAALLLSGGIIYTSWTSHCDNPPYGGWVIAYNESLQQIGVLNLAANSTAGPSIWMSMDGPAADTSGNVYLVTANGAFDTLFSTTGFPSLGDYGNAVVKLSLTGSTLQVADYFAPSNTATLTNGDPTLGVPADSDLGSGGEMLFPDMKDASGKVRHLVVASGKDGRVFVVDRDNMGKLNATDQVYQELAAGTVLAAGAVTGGGVTFSTPGYFNQTLYYCAVSDHLRAIPVQSALLATTPKSLSPETFPYPGCTPAISANGATNGIVWVQDNGVPAVLHAYDATNLANELYMSSANFGAGNKFATPVVIDGKVLVAGNSQQADGTYSTAVVAIFGLGGH